MDWTEGLDKEQQAQWDAFVKHAREETFRAMDSSAMVMSLVPKNEPDVKFAVELGMAIMLDKPIIAVAMAGVGIPPKMRLVADHVIELDEDLDTEAGQAAMHREFAKAMATLGLGKD